MLYTERETNRGGNSGLLVGRFCAAFMRSVYRGRQKHPIPKDKHSLGVNDPENARCFIWACGMLSRPGQKVNNTGGGGGLYGVERDFGRVIWGSAMDY